MLSKRMSHSAFRASLIAHVMNCLGYLTQATIRMILKQDPHRLPLQQGVTSSQGWSSPCPCNRCRHYWRGGYLCWPLGLQNSYQLF